MDKIHLVFKNAVEPKLAYYLLIALSSVSTFVGSFVDHCYNATGIQHLSLVSSLDF